MFEYHLPAFNHKEATDEEFAQKFAHLAYIREDEAKYNLGQ